MTKGIVAVQTVHELFCTVCDWSVAAYSESEAEDRATEHELSHEAAA